MSSESLPEGEYNNLVQILNDLADQSGVYYVYAFVLDGNNVVHLTTSASMEERAAGDWSQFREPYQEPPNQLLQTFVDGQSRFEEYTDEFGSFRSIFVRHPGKDGHFYVTGVDVSLDSIHSDLAALVKRYLLAGGLVTILAGALGILLARRIAHPLLELSHEVDAWSSRGFGRDDAIRAHLESIARKYRDESGDLARRFVDLQDRLETYLRQLTETTAAKQKIEHQLEIAKTIQEGLLPEKMPRIPNFEIVGWSQPADQTGGDYFDWIELPNGQVMLTIGDVTGHGIGPALVTAASRAYARATFNSDDALESTISRLNDLLHGDLKGERFVTLVACLLNPAERQMKMVAAGHGPLIYFSCKRNEVDVITDSQGVPLGIMGDVKYDRPIELKFDPGDALVLVSDGFFEWMNAHGETFGIERLSGSILNSCREAQDQIIDRLRRDIAEFHRGTSQADDTTALIIRCIA
jgi:sigma-B regulation protein RsbU (phosphoserine phosphatase)